MKDKVIATFRKALKSEDSGLYSKSVYEKEVVDGTICITIHQISNLYSIKWSFDDCTKSFNINEEEYSKLLEEFENEKKTRNTQKEENREKKIEKDINDYLKS